jgi:hypothetical protein
MNAVTHTSRGKLPNAGKPWTDQDDSDLLDMDAEGWDAEAMVDVLGRTAEDIKWRLEQLKPRVS